MPMRRLLPLVAVLLAACQAPPVESFPPGGNAPIPTGILTGTVLYQGPRPVCIRDRNGKPTGIAGRVVLLLFSWDHLPAPYGDATTAANLLTVPGDQLFGNLKTDCLPAKPTPADLAVRITRSAPYTWPQITLGDDYQIRAFYDETGDFSPFYSVANQPTRGDVLGGAFVDPTSPAPVYAHIPFGTIATFPKGQRVEGVTVALAAPADTERPLFSLDPDTLGLDGEATLPATSDPVAGEAALWDLTKTRLDLAPPANPKWKAALKAAKLGFDLDPSGEAWFIRPVDLNGDGQPDPHPILGPQGVEWDTPLVIFQRARTPAEVEAGIPVVRLIGSVRPTHTLFKKVIYPSLDILVPPVALVSLDPANPACTVPYIPPGNLAPLYEGQPVECQEVPSGDYDIDVFQGIAGGTPRERRRPGHLRHRLRRERRLLHRTDLDHPQRARPRRHPLPPLGGRPAPPVRPPRQPGPRRSVPGLRREPRATACATTAPRPRTRPQAARRAPVTYTPVPSKCCAAVKHLCGIRLCDARDDGHGHLVREATVVDNGKPTCVPFLPPASCCP